MKFVRAILIVLLAAVVLAAGAETLRADVAHEAKYLWNGSWRGNGFYLSWLKIVFSWLVFVTWVGVADWVNRDLEDTGLNYQKWNPIVVGSFMGTMLLNWLLPWFWLNYILLLLGAIAPIATYIAFRNGQVAHHEKVLTKAHLRYWFADLLSNVGVRVAKEQADPNTSGSPVKVYGRGGKDKIVDGANLLAARQSTGLIAARKILFDGLKARASAIVLDFGQTNAAVRYLVDGVWLPQEAIEREGVGDPALEALKILCALSPEDRRTRQEGKFGVEYSVIKKDVFAKMDRAEAAFREKAVPELTRRLASEELVGPALQQEVAKTIEEQARLKFASAVGVWTPVDKEKLPTLPGVDEIHPITSLEVIKCPAKISTQGTQAGERVIVEFEMKGVHLGTLDELGMRAKMQEQFKELLASPKGIILFSAMPSGGLRTTTKVALHGMDRFVREFAAVEDELNRYDEVENIAVTTYNSKTGPQLAQILPKVFREQPNVLVVRDIPNVETMKIICQEIETNGRTIVSTIRAKDCAEALLRMYALEKAPVPEFREKVVMVLGQRLVRKLCDKCKEPYAPPQEVLKQLGLPADKVRAFFRPPQPKPGEEDQKDICRECGGIGYLGQTAIFELMPVDDLLRKTLATTPKLDALRLAARKSGMKTLQEEGILMVVRGATSLPELMRVLKS